MRVFISHASDDRDLANRLATLLKARQIDARTSAHLLPENDWKVAIKQEVAKAEGFVFLINAQSNDDRWRQIECQAALELDWDRELGMPMVPVLTGDIAVPAFLADRVVLTAEESLDPLITRIVNLLFNPDSARLPLNYTRAHEERQQRFDLVKSFALSLKSENQFS